VDSPEKELLAEKLAGGCVTSMKRMHNSSDRKFPGGNKTAQGRLPSHGPDAGRLAANEGTLVNRWGKADCPRAIDDQGAPNRESCRPARDQIPAVFQ